MFICPGRPLSRSYSKVNPFQLLRGHSGVRQRSLQWRFIHLPCFPGQPSPSPLWFSEVTSKIYYLCLVPFLPLLFFPLGAVVLAPQVGLQMRSWVLESKTRSRVSQMAVKSTLLMVSARRMSLVVCGRKILECGRSGWGCVGWCSAAAAAPEQDGAVESLWVVELLTSCLRNLDNTGRSKGQQTTIKAFRKFLHPEMWGRVL